MNHNSVSFSNLSPGDPATGTAYSDPANEYVSGTNDAAAQALRTNLRNLVVRSAPAFWNGWVAPSVTPSSAPTTLLRASSSATRCDLRDGRRRSHHILQRRCREAVGLPPRIRKQRVLRLLEALLARREANGSPSMSNGRSVERKARDTRRRGDGGAP